MWSDQHAQPKIDRGGKKRKEKKTCLLFECILYNWFLREMGALTKKSHEYHNTEKQTKRTLTDNEAEKSSLMDNSENTDPTWET